MVTLIVGLVWFVSLLALLYLFLMWRAGWATTFKLEVVVEFTLGGELFEAVRVHYRRGNTFLPVEEVIRCADTEGRVVRSYKDWDRVWKHRADLPTVLEPYWLATAFPFTRWNYDGISCIRHNKHDGWSDCWSRLGGGWEFDKALLLRRRT